MGIHVCDPSKGEVEAEGSDIFGNIVFEVVLGDIRPYLAPKQKGVSGSGEMAQQSRALAALAEDPVTW